MAPPLSSTERSRRWRARHPGVDARWNRNGRRVYVGRYYVGVAPTEDQAQSINQETREEFHDRKNQSAA